jgi:opacity protein-like surface antigen
MKALTKILLALFLLLTTSAVAFSQVEKGAVLVGGSIGFEYKGQKNASTINLNILPRVGYFTGKHFMIGFNLGYDFAQEKTTYVVDPISGAKTSSYRINHGLLIGPIFRPYYMLAPKVAIFTNISPMFGISEYRLGKSIKDSRNITKSLVWQIGPGIDIFVSKNVAIEFSVYYQGSYNNNYLKDDNLVIPNTSNKYVLHGVNTNLGFNYFFLAKRATTTGKP